MKVSPLTIRIMLACYYSSNPEDEIGLNIWGSNSVREIRDWLISNDLVGENYRATERGKAWVRFICETPLPILSWRLPDREAAE